MSKVITNCTQCEHFDPDPREPSCRKMEAEGRGVYESLLSWEYVRRNVIPPNCPLKNAEATNSTVMNNRIDELAEQAGFVDKGNNITAYLNFDHEKFAELIIKECAGVELYWLNEQDRKAVAEKIKQHFGVQE